MLVEEKNYLELTIRNKHKTFLSRLKNYNVVVWDEITAGLLKANK